METKNGGGVSGFLMHARAISNSERELSPRRSRCKSKASRGKTAIPWLLARCVAGAAILSDVDLACSKKELAEVVYRAMLYL